MTEVTYTLIRKDGTTVTGSAVGKDEPNIMIDLRKGLDLQSGDFVYFGEFRKVNVLHLNKSLATYAPV